MTSGSRYTREVLVQAAKSCSDIDEVIAFLGTRPYMSLRRYLYRRFDHFAIDISHFPRRGPHGSKPRPPGSVLREIVVQSSSVADALRRLGRPDNARLRALFRQWIAEDGLDTSHFLGQAHQRGKRGTTPLKTADHVLVESPSGRRTKTELLRRALREIGVPEECAECGTGPSWRGSPMTLEVDHVNGDRHDNRAGNLRLLCPNCHAVTRTWCRGGAPRKEPGGIG